MGATNFQIHPEHIIRLAELFKAMGHPARLRAVLMALESEEGLSIDEIKDEVKLSQSTISAHLKVLRTAGIIKTKMVVRDKKSSLRIKVEPRVVEAFLQDPLLVKFWALKDKILAQEMEDDSSYYSQFIEPELFNT